MCAPAIMQFASLAISAASTASAQRSADKAAKQQAQALKDLKASSAVTAPQPTRRARNDLAGGYASTLLTGPSGVAPGSQNVGSNTLLGQ